MKIKFVKIISLILALLMLSSALLGCERDKNDNPEAVPDTTEQLPNEEQQEEQQEEEQQEIEEFDMKQIENPIRATGADPWVIRHGDKYYYCYTRNNWPLGGVAVAELDSLEELADAEGKQVYLASEDQTEYWTDYWAPELHYLNGEWYIYVAADDGKNENHRMCVFKGTTQDPTDPFEFVGVITDPSNKWAIDGTVMQLDGEMYFIWSGWEGDVNVAQNIYIAHMSDPCTIDSERVCLSRPEYSWEKIGTPYVNEGPAVLQREGKTFVAYSASGSWTDNYCLGLLTLTGDDPMNVQHWNKASSPVFQKQYGTAFGPGHNSFTTAADGSVWMIYHANAQSGTGWKGRSIWLAPITFDENGVPIFGKPAKSVQLPVKKEAQ